MWAGQTNDQVAEPAWAALDREHPGEQMTVRVGGAVLRMRRAVDVPPQLLVRGTSDWRLFLGLIVDNPQDLGEFPWWKAEHLVRLYRRHVGLCATVDDDLRLLHLLEQDDYRDAIEYDLQALGVDLGGQFRARRWRRLLNLVHRLPRTSQFGEQVAADEKLAAYILDRERQKGAGGDRVLPERKLSEFSVEAELLSVVVDRLGELLQVQVAKRGGKARPVKPMPRPETAVQKMRRKKEIKHVEFTLDRIFGRVDADGKPTGAAAPTS